MSRLPTYFISHGGGPWPWIKDLLPGDWTLLESSLRAIPSQLGTTPTAVRYDLTTETATPVVSWTSSLGSAAGTALVR